MLFVALFIFGLALFFQYDESKKHKAIIANKLEKARKAKAEKAKFDQELKNHDQAIDDLKNLEDKIIENNGIQEKKEKAD